VGAGGFTAAEHLDLFVLAVMLTVFALGLGSLRAHTLAAGWFAGLFALTAALPQVTRRWPSTAWIRWIVPGVVLVSVYESLGPVIAALGPPLRDGWVLAIERWVTGGRLPPLAPLRLSALAGDVLSAAYVAYFGLPVVVIGSLLRRRQAAGAQAALLTLLLTFYAHYVIYVLVPAVGPARTLELPLPLRLQLLEVGGRLTHVLRHLVGALERTPQDAFPSAHTSIALLCAAVARKHTLPLRWCVYVATAAIVASTVLLAYHYVVDVVAAVPLAWLAWRAALKLVQPGGQASERPPMRCRWMWNTVCPASRFVLNTVRNPPAEMPRSFAIAAARRTTSPTIASSPASRSLSELMWRFGTTSTWVGACGLMSLKARTRSSS
jgi:membrane-associated phospholipid phosphatase